MHGKKSYYIILNMIEKILLIYIANILSGCDKENTSDNSEKKKEKETIYVSAGDFKKPFYKFYSDENGIYRINKNGILTLNSNKIYIFKRLNEAKSHPFDIKLKEDDKLPEGENEFKLKKTFEPKSKRSFPGIIGSETLTIELINYHKNVKIEYFCTSHSGMIKEIEFKS